MKPCLVQTSQGSGTREVDVRRSRQFAPVVRPNAGHMSAMAIRRRVPALLDRQLAARCAQTVDRCMRRIACLPRSLERFGNLLPALPQKVEHISAHEIHTLAASLGVNDRSIKVVYTVALDQLL